VSLTADECSRRGGFRFGRPQPMRCGASNFPCQSFHNPLDSMPLSSKLDRKLRAAEESSDEEEYYEVTDRSSSASVIEFGDAEEIPSSDEDGDGSEDEEMVRSHPVRRFIG
jgi:hypothetical protein